MNRLFHTEYRIKTIWDEDVLIVFTDDIIKSVDKCKTKYDVSANYEGQAEGLYAYSRDTKIEAAGLIFFQIDKASPGRIAHESLHCIKEILERLPSKFSEKTEEVWCYTLEDTVDKIYETYLKAVKKYKLRGKKNKS